MRLTMLGMMVALVAMALTGCGGSARVEGLDDSTADRVTVHTQPFEKASQARKTRDSEDVDAFLRGWVWKQGGQSSHQVFVRTEGLNDFRNWHTLQVSRGGQTVEFSADRVEFASETTNQKSPVYREAVAVDVERGFLEWMAGRDALTMRLIGSEEAGAQEFTIRGSEAEAYLRAIDETRATIGGR